MAERVLMKGNEAIAEAAIRAGCRHYFGYPITPQTEIAAYMAKKMPKIGGVFLQEFLCIGKAASLAIQDASEAREGIRELVSSFYRFLCKVQDRRDGKRSRNGGAQAFGHILQAAQGSFDFFDTFRKSTVIQGCAECHLAIMCQRISPL